MCRFIESIRFEEGTYHLLDYHQKRVNRTFAEIFSGSVPHDLSAILPPLDFVTRHKARLAYDANGFSISLSEYQIRPIGKIQLVFDNTIEYHLKNIDRNSLGALYAKRGIANDILIIKNGLVTDSYYANPAFWDGKEWLVPNSYLLNGVKRQYLLAKNMIREIDIREEDIASFEKVSFINAMLDLEEVEIPITQILN
ncbi:MAG: 4-amino-4-deoxychorismate lyase [Marinoscillum sp.]|jgi:4-amino-4-deoxychorismate lyase